jgi:hypothetical protein
MYSTYQLINLESDNFSNYVHEGLKIEQETLKQVRTSLDSYLSPSGAVDSAKMMANWFPEIDCNVFISHSRADKDLALGISGFLSMIGLKPFIDSNVWHHGNDLLRIMDKKWCYQPKTESEDASYSYEKRNITTSHVHMMLATALTKMMDHCESMFFLNTTNSINSLTPQNLVNGDESVTHSPWLFHEISMMQLLRRRAKEEHRDGLSNFSENIEKRASSDIPRFDYPADLNGISTLSQRLLEQWNTSQSGYVASLIEEKSHPLDSLYRLVPPHHGR